MIVAGVLFFFSFLVFRLALNLYGTVLLLFDEDSRVTRRSAVQAAGRAMPERVAWTLPRTELCAGAKVAAGRRFGRHRRWGERLKTRKRSGALRLSCRRGTSAEQ